ncbi:beta-lactamase family protein [candidate division KSB1 bacterium]|nr:beta-lactamase family protein [candidate division KSB1 bacterium]
MSGEWSVARRTPAQEPVSQRMMAETAGFEVTCGFGQIWRNVEPPQSSGNPFDLAQIYIAMKSPFPLAALFLAIALNISGSSAADESLERRIERVIHGLLPETSLQNQFGPKASLRERMARFHTPGVSIAVVNDYKIEWARGFGVKEWGKSAPVTERTLFQAGSISKPIFALAVMRLAQEGKLDLDRDVNEYHSHPTAGII